MEVKIGRWVRRLYKNNVLSITLHVVYNVYFMVSLVMKCLYFQYANQINIYPYNTPVNNSMLRATIGVMLIILAILILLFKRKRTMVLIIINLLISFALLADTLYFRYYANAITVPVLSQMGLMGSIGESIKSLFVVQDMIYFIDFPIFIIGAFLINKYGRYKGNNYKRIGMAAAICIIGVIIVNITYFSTDYINFNYDNHYTMRKMGVVYFHYYDIKRYIRDHWLQEKTLSAQDKELIESFYKNKPDAGKDFHGVAKGKNLIIVQMEAIQDLVINREILGKEITPNMNRLIKDNSYYFRNHYQQIGGGNTSDAEFLTNTSMYPLRNGAVYFRFPTNEYDTLPKALKKEGYKTYVCHAYRPSFWNRSVMYDALGFDKFLSLDDYELDEQVGWSVSDASFFRQSLDQIETSEPFYGFFITLSSHHPYYAFANYDFDVGEYEGTMLGNYIKSAHYVDSCIGGLIEELKVRGLYDDTVIVMYGDHVGLFKDEEENISSFLGVELDDINWKKVYRLPLIIHNPSLPKTKKMDITSGQVDLLPTLSNLMDLDIKYAMGKDLLNTEKGYAILNSGSVVTDDYIFVNESGFVYDTKTGEMLNKEEYIDEIKAYQQLLNISEIMIKKDALKELSDSIN